MGGGVESLTHWLATVTTSAIRTPSHGGRLTPMALNCGTNVAARDRRLTTSAMEFRIFGFMGSFLSRHGGQRADKRTSLKYIPVVHQLVKKKPRAFQ